MATTTDGRRLTDTHRRLQARIALLTVRDLLGIWAILGPNPPTQGRTERDVARLEAWLVAAEAIIERRRFQSITVATRYYDDFRTAEIGARFTGLGTVTAPSITTGQIRTGLMVRGPREWERALGRGMDPFAASRFAAIQAAREASRQVLDGGRGQIVEATRRDTAVTAWFRSTRSGNPCAFCAMLAGRGPVYGSAHTAAFEAHANCLCQPEPFFGPNPKDRSNWSDTARLARQVYDESTQGERDPLNAFRRAWDARHVANPAAPAA